MTNYPTKLYATKKPTAIDLFSGCGGLTLGLKKAGFRVLAAIENDALACATYRANHKSTHVIEADIRTVKPAELLIKLGVGIGELDLVAGCPPCQGFSSLKTKNGRRQIDDPMNDLVFEFVRIALALKPKAIMLENVPGLATNRRMECVLERLRAANYKCKLAVLNAADYGAPQRRRRMILIAMLGGEPILGEPVKKRKTVRSSIGRLPAPAYSSDPLHNYHTQHNPKVRSIIKMIPKNGGSRTELPDDLKLTCHKTSNGFRDVYGRMAWDEASPTITGGCINPSKGRFIHPEQDRAITLREAALLQGFPRTYHFDLTQGRHATAQMIGNAFPPIFAKRHAMALLTALTNQL